MTTNDISVRPSKQQITIKGIENLQYGCPKTEQEYHAVRRAQSYILRAPPHSSVVWPGEFLEVNLPSDIDLDSTLAIEPRIGSVKPQMTTSWPEPFIVEAVGGKVRLVNSSIEPQFIQRN